MNSNTEPLDRMNYFNGQRLEATDFLLDQAYHMRVRRLLNSSLYSYGIASGLEVLVKEGDPHRVVVSPGLALDPEGREIVVLEETELLVTGLPSPVEGVVFGNYLTIRYDEGPVNFFQDGCQAGGSGSQRLAWGGPTRVRERAVLEWQNNWPAEDSGQIVLVQAELDETCAVRELRAGVRKYIRSQPTRALTYALEGEKDIDSSNPKQIYFHIRGGQPEAVTFYLRAAKFSSLYYTEMGKHVHSLDVSLPNHTGVAAHTHTLDELTTSTEPGHDHGVSANTSDDVSRNRLELSTGSTRRDLIKQVDMTVDLSAEHSHTIEAGGDTGPAEGMPALEHNFSAAEVGETGLGPDARTQPEKVYSYPDNLEILVDGISYTPEILNRLGWTSLGDGTANHDLVQAGTGPVQIDLLGVDLSEGEHVIELRLASGGGRVLYNLYVE